MRFDGLAGAPGQSLIPEWLDLWLRSGLAGAALIRDHQDLFKATGAQPVLPSELIAKCDQIGELLARNLPAIETAPVGGLSHENFPSVLLRDLPILQSTARRLETEGTGLDVAVAKFGANSMGELRSRGFSWLEIFDLSQCICEWSRDDLPENQLSVENAWPSLAEESTFTGDATTFEELAHNFLSELIFLDGSRIPQEHIGLYLGRFGWGEKRLTLDEVGSHLGVTRERVRQIIKRLMVNGAERRWPIGRAVEERFAKLLDGGVFADFGGFSGIWTLESFRDLLTRVGATKWVQEIELQVSPEFAVGAALVSQIRSTRTSTGLIHMAQLEINTEGQFSRAHLERAVRTVYPESAFFGQWAIAAAGRDTQFHNAIALQFAMNDSIEIGELAEGLARVQAGRSDGSPLPDLPTFKGLLIAAELIDPSTHLYIGEPYRFENNGTGFIHMVVKNSPGQVIHIDQLSQRLAELAVNPTTTAHYASYQAGLRRDVSGVLVYAAGAKPTDEEMRAVRRQGELSNHETEIQFAIAAGEVVFNVVLGTALLYRGAFTVPAAARSFVEDEYLVQCACGKEFESKARISPGNQWNISYLTNHLCVEHDVRPGRTIQLKTEGGKLTAQI